MEYRDYAGQAFNNYFDNRNRMRENAANRQLEYDKLNTRYGNRNGVSTDDTLDIMSKLNQLSIHAQQMHQFADQTKKQKQKEFLTNAGSAMAILRNPNTTKEQKMQAQASMRSLWKQFSTFFDEEIQQMPPEFADVLENGKPTNINEITSSQLRSLQMQLNSTLNGQGIGFSIHNEIKDEDVYNARNDLTTMSDVRNNLAMKPKRTFDSTQRLKDLQGATEPQGTEGEFDYIPPGTDKLRPNRQNTTPADYQPDLSNEGQLALERKDQLTDPNYEAPAKGFRDFNTYEMLQILRDGNDAECLAGLNDAQKQAMEKAINIIQGGLFYNDKFADLNSVAELMAADQIESYGNILSQAQAQYGFDNLHHLQQENIMEHNRKDNIIQGQNLQNKVTEKQSQFVDGAKSPRQLANAVGGSFNMDEKTGINTQSHEPAYAPATTGGPSKIEELKNNKERTIVNNINAALGSNYADMSAFTQDIIAGNVTEEQMSKMNTHIIPELGMTTGEFARNSIAKFNDAVKKLDRTDALMQNTSEFAAMSKEDRGSYVVRFFNAIGVNVGAKSEVDKTVGDMEFMNLVADFNKNIIGDIKQSGGSGYMSKPYMQLVEGLTAKGMDAKLAKEIARKQLSRIKNDLMSMTHDSSSGTSLIAAQKIFNIQQAEKIADAYDAIGDGYTTSNTKVKGKTELSFASDGTIAGQVWIGDTLFNYIYDPKTKTPKYGVAKQ